MADKVCCPGPLSNQGGATASGGAFREAVCVHTSKVYDSCRSKECLRDIRVYLTREAQDMLNSGGIASVKPRAADLLCVKIDVEPVQFNRGLYSVDSRFFYRIECEVSCAVGRPRIIDGLAVFDKRVMLFGGEGGARIFSSRYIEDGSDVQLRPNSNRPTAVVEVVDPIMLDARVVEPEASCNCCCCALRDVPRPLCSCFGGDELVLTNDGYQLFVTLGQFSIIRLERDIQLLDCLGAHALGLIGTLSGAAGDLAVGQGQGNGNIAAKALGSAGEVAGSTRAGGSGRLAAAAVAQQAHCNNSGHGQRCNALFHLRVFHGFFFFLLS